MNRRLTVLLIGCASAVSAGTDAAVFEVDTTSDLALSACTAVAADCSLRGAILAANAVPGADRIVFALTPDDAGFIVATAHWRISAATAMPANDGALEIDGYSQAGAVPNTLTPDLGGSNAVIKVELRNTGGAANTGLESSGNNFAAVLAVRGLAINRFASQIILAGGGGHRVEGCFLGTDVTGQSAALADPNGRGTGVRIQGQGASVIGGEAASARNVISGLGTGIASFAVSEGLRIEGNLIGTNAAGTAAVANLGDGISLGSFRQITIGGRTAGARNVISGNAFAAIRAASATPPIAFPNLVIAGNHIGSDWSGQVPIGNGLNPASPSQPQATILLGGAGACSVEIGGFEAGAANLIANGGGEGVMVGACARVSAAGNRYSGHRAMAIDNSTTSFGDGPNANDAGDPDGGGNRLQNAPVALSATPAGGDEFSLSFHVDSSPAHSAYPLRVDFFRGRGGDVLAHLGTRSIALGDAQTTLTVVLPLAALADGSLQMIATDADGNTSEVSRYGLDAMFADGFE